MSEIKTKIRTYNDVIDLFGEEKAADMLSEALDWSTIDPKNDKKNIMERKPLLLDPYMTYEDEDYCKHIVAGFLEQCSQLVLRGFPFPQDISQSLGQPHLADTGIGLGLL